MWSRVLSETLLQQRMIQEVSSNISSGPVETSQNLLIQDFSNDRPRLGNLLENALRFILFVTTSGTGHSPSEEVTGAPVGRQCNMHFTRQIWWTNVLVLNSWCQKVVLTPRYQMITTLLSKHYLMNIKQGSRNVKYTFKVSVSSKYTAILVCIFFCVSLKSHVEVWDVKFISTLFWTTTDLSAKTTSLMDIFEHHRFFGGGLFGNSQLQI